MSNKKTLIIFTRYPEAGKTKTRLIPALGEEGAANFQRQMTEQTVVKARKFQAKNPPLNIEVHFAGGNQELMQTWIGKDLKFKVQQGKDLGAKMLSAFQQVLCIKQQPVVIIGIDCPDLSESILQEAFEASNNHDLVLGKARDGGYYLIGLKTVKSQLFENIKWGTSQVFRQTENIAKKLNLKIYTLPILKDIDRPEDLIL